MPYITQDERDLIWSAGEIPVNAGELNYATTRLIHEYLKIKGVCYHTINEVIGVLECAKMELYRTIASPYEDKKRSENGSVSDLDDNNREKMR